MAIFPFPNTRVTPSQREPRDTWATTVLCVTHLWAAASTALATPKLLHHELQVRGCAASFEAEVRRLMDIELTSLAAARGRTQVPPRFHRWLVTCQPNGYVLDIFDQHARRVTSRQLNGGKVPNKAHSRLVALALTEMVMGPTGTQGPPRRPPRREKAPPPLTLQSPVKVPEEGQWEVSLLGSASILGDPTLLHWGGGLLGGWGGLSPWWLSMDAHIITGELDFEAGTIHSLLLHGGVQLHYEHKWRSLRLRMGLGGRLGYARLAGVTDQPERYTAAQVDGTWAACFGSLHLQRTLGQTFFFAVGMEAGWVLIPVKGTVEEQQVYGADRLWVQGRFLWGLRF